MILYSVADRPRSVGERCDPFDLTQANASHHLAVLRDQGLVQAERDGNRVVRSQRDHRVVKAVDLLRAAMDDEPLRRRSRRGHGTA